MTVEDGGQRVQTDKERLLELLATYRVVPVLVTHDYLRITDAEHVNLVASIGGVRGVPGASCEFVFHPDGSFYEVGVWE
jgi:hypothetical protein